MIEPQEILAFNDFIEACEDAYKQFDGTVWYRGHSSSNEAWKLQPSIFRAATYRSNDRAKQPHAEINMAHFFRVHAPLRYSHCPATDDLAGWLSLMQPHGLPTRLLDWTEAPLTALFFAMEGGPDHKAIWALDPYKLNESATGSSEVYGLWEPKMQPLLTPVFEPNAAMPSDDVAAVQASEIDMRMLMQQGSFTIHASDASLEDRPNADQFLRKFVIPVGRRHNFQRAIKVFAIHRSNIYPDLTNLALEVKQKETDSTSHSIFIDRPSRRIVIPEGKIVTPAPETLDEIKRPGA